MKEIHRISDQKRCGDVCQSSDVDEGFLGGCIWGLKEVLTYLDDDFMAQVHKNRLAWTLILVSIAVMWRGVKAQELLGYPWDA